MSDLAPFVAAAIESRVVTDLKEENDRLRAEIEETRAAALQSARWGGILQITGEGGAPVYAHGMIHTAVKGFEDDDAFVYRLDLSNYEHATCPISKALSAEVRINGVKIATVDQSDDISSDSIYGDVYAKMQYHFRTGCGTIWGGFGLDIVYGPLEPLGDQLQEPNQLRDEDVEEVKFPRLMFIVRKETVRAGDVYYDIVHRYDDYHHLGE